MRVLAAMSGGVDSSVAAALLIEAGHEVVGVTMKLWDAPAASGCCSEAEIDDARAAANKLGVDHLVFTFLDRFEATVVSPYAEAHAAGLTPNPCVECNRHVKFGRLLERARQLGFDSIATGHHARIERRPGQPHRLLRGADAAKDQSYVLYVLGQSQLERCLFPVGHLDKGEVRRRAADLGLATADKPDSQDVCFVTGAGGREAFLSPRIELRPGRVVDLAGATIGRVPAVEMVTVGQRRALGSGGGSGEKRYAIAVDTATSTVVTGRRDDLLTDGVDLRDLCWVGGRPAGATQGPNLEAQCSAHGRPVPARFTPAGHGGTVRFQERHPRVAPGQSVVLYAGDEVLGGGIAV